MTTGKPGSSLDRSPPGGPPRRSTDLLELRDRLRTLPAKKRLDAILERPDVLRVVRSLPPQDLYATMREVGLEDSLELLELCHPRQVQIFLDLDGWRRDRIDPIAHLGWLRALLTANPDRAVSQIRGLDVELLTLLLKLHARIYDLSIEEEPEEEVGLHTVTPDNRYLISYDAASADEGVLLTLKETVERLLGRDMLFVLRLCEAVRWEMPSALEEDAFRWRNGRIADLGFVPTHEAMDIFAAVDPDRVMQDDREPSWSRPAPEIDADADPVTDLSTSVLLPWDLFTDGSNALGRAMQGLSDEERARVAHELMMTANRLHAAEGGDPGDPEALKTTVRTCADTVGVAVSYLSRGDPERLATPLRKVQVRVLFQVGHSLALRLQQELKTRIRGKDSGLGGGGLVRLDSPLREVTAGLLRPRPLFYAGLLDPKRLDFHPFSSLGELAAAAQALSEAAFRAALLGKRGLGADDEHLAAHGRADPASQPPHAAILASALIRAALGEALQPLPLDEDHLAAVAAQVERPSGRLPAPAEEKALGALDALVRKKAPLPGAKSPDEASQRAAAYARSVLAGAAAEIARVEGGAPDARFLGAVWTTNRP